MKTAFITGASGGIGAAIAKHLAEAGYRVALGYNTRAETAETVRRQLTGEGHFALWCQVDDAKSIEKTFETLKDRFGTLQLLVNSAGFTRFVPHARLDLLDDELIDTLFKVHLRGALACVRAAQPFLSENSCVVNLSSIAGESGMGSNVAYCMAKAGVDNMTRALARALAPKTRVMSVAPGFVDTPFVKQLEDSWRAEQVRRTPLGRLVTTAEIAAAVLACAQLLTCSTGRVLYLDGGRHLG